LSQRSPGGIDKRVPPAVQRGGLREAERIVDQSICIDLKVNIRASRMCNPMAAKDGAERLLPFENQRSRRVGKMFQVDLDSPKSHRYLAAFRDQDHLPRQQVARERASQDAKLNALIMSALEGRRHVPVMDQQAPVWLGHVPAIHPRHQRQRQSQLLVKLVQRID